MLGYPEFLNTHELLFIRIIIYKHDIPTPPSHKIISMLLYHDFENKKNTLFIFSSTDHIKHSNEMVFK